jgi:transposase
MRMNRSELRYKKRKEVVEAILVRNEPVHLVARVYNVPRRTVFEWLARYRNGGWDALKEGARQGRPRKLTGEAMQWIYEAVTMGNPLNYQFDFSLWKLNILRSMIEHEFGVKLSKSSVNRVLKHLGLSPQRPLYKSYKQDPKKIEAYLKRAFSEVVEQAKRVGAEIYFVDEASVRSDSTRRHALPLYRRKDGLGAVCLFFENAAERRWSANHRDYR